MRFISKEILNEAVLQKSMRTLCFLVVLLAGIHQATHGQSLTLAGVVFDSASGLGIEAAEIHVNQSINAERSDSLGAFSLTGLAPGEFNLTIAKEGYKPEVFWFTITSETADTLDIGGLPLAPTSDVITGALSGTILDEQSRLPVIGAGISVNGQLAAFSDDSGSFVTGIVGVSPGLNTVEFKRIGYDPYTFRLWAVRRHTDFDIEITMTSLPMEMEAVVVEADRTVFAFGALRDFYRRRQSRMGHFITQVDIDEQHPMVTSDLFRQVPGMVVRPGRWGGNRIESLGTRDLTRGCGSFTIFIDGHYISTESSEELDWLVHPNEIAGIEVYPRPGQVPGRFKIAQAVCGVIAVWTKWRS